MFLFSTKNAGFWLSGRDSVMLRFMEHDVIVLELVEIMDRSGRKDRFWRYFPYLTSNRIWLPLDCEMKILAEIL